MGDTRPSASTLTAVSLTMLLACLAGVWTTSPLLAAAVTAVSLPILVRFATHAKRHVELTRSLNEASHEGRYRDVTVRWSSLPDGAVVAGLRRPQIFCDERLAERLSDDELAAVVLHERHHQLRADPLRLLLLATVEPLVGRSAVGRRWLARRRADMEIAADRFALDLGVRRSHLAGAILALADASASGHGAAGFTSSDELRLRALLDDRPDGSIWRQRRGSARVVLAGVVATICGGTLLHHLAASGGRLGCVLVVC